jgi:hypothetical protein
MIGYLPVQKNIEDVNTNLRVFFSGSDSNKENLLPPATPKRPAEDGEILLILCYS